MEQLRRIRNSTFVRHNAIFFVGSLSIGLLNYLYYPVLGHLLHPSNFGEVQTLFSLFAQISIFLSVLGLLTINIVANYQDAVLRNRVIFELEKLALAVGIILLLTALVMGGELARFFRFESSLPFVLLAAAVVATIPLTFRTAYLRGRQYFGVAALIGVVASAGDLLLSVVFVLAGWRSTGAIAGLVLAQLAAFGYAAAAAHRRGFTETLRGRFFRLPDMRLIAPELRYSLLVFVGSLGITGMYSVDVIAAKHYFDARTAGLYAGISTIARIIFFLTTSITQVLLPAIRLNKPTRQNQRVLLRSFLLLTGIGGLALLCFWLASHAIIRLLMGSAYTPYAYLLPRLSLAIFIISILNLFVMYHMALRRYMIMLVVVLGGAATFGLLSIHHQTPLAVVNSLLYGSIVMAALLGLWVGSNIKNTTREELS